MTHVKNEVACDDRQLNIGRVLCRKRAMLKLSNFSRTEKASNRQQRPTHVEKEACYGLVCKVACGILTMSIIDELLSGTNV